MSGRHPSPRRPRRSADSPRPEAAKRSAPDGPTARLFVAVVPPADALAELAAVADGLATYRAGARPTDRARWHITVAFLGEVAEERIPDATDALADAAARSTPVRLRIAGGGRFGRGRFAVLWAGVAGAADSDLTSFAGLARAVRRELRRARLPYDDKPFRPHLTLARPGDRIGRDELSGDVDRLRAYAGTPFPVEEVWLYRSHLGPHPKHTPLAHWPLGPA
ncbi:MAG TPA: RNA 2',3'-cyclic phosphodiesterase [Actinocatenispora sp.]